MTEQEKRSALADGPKSERGADEDDLAVARMLKWTLVPEKLPERKGYEFAAFHQRDAIAATEYYNWWQIDQDRVVFGLLQCSGFSLASSMLLTYMAGVAAATIPYEDDLGRALAKMNRAFTHYPDRTSWLGMLTLLQLDASRHQLTVASAGSQVPLIREASGKVRALREVITGLPFGVDEHASYEAVSVPLAEGDCVVAFTDGVTDAMNSHRQCYTLGRLQQALQMPTVDVSTTVANVELDLREFVRNSTYREDATLLAISRTVSE